MTLRLFLSYASEQRNTAEKIYAALTAADYIVFFDSKSLPAGEEYNRKIYDAIRTSDLMIFLVSPDSVEEGSYTRTELLFAEEVWRNPHRRVIPVMVKDTDFSEIPEYLKSVTILNIIGNSAAEVVRVIDEFASADKNKSLLEITNELNERIKRQEIRETLSQLDDDWDQERRKYTVKINGVDIDYVPSSYFIGIIPLIFGIVLSLLGNRSFYGTGGLSTILPLFFGIGVAIYFCKTVKDYKTLEDDYLRQREAVADGEFNYRYKFLHLP